jgi:hypothetical protein
LRWPHHVAAARCEPLLYALKAGPAGGRLRRPSSRRQRHGGLRGAGFALHNQARERPSRGRRCLTQQYDHQGRPAIHNNVGRVRRLAH